MGESGKHMHLVQAIITWIYERFEKDHICLCADTSLFPFSSRPKPIDGYVPDILAENITGKRLKIIGEAKTAGDLDTKHSELQIQAFLKSCSLYEDTSFILAVPWEETKYAKSLLKHFKKMLGIKDVKIIVINEFGNES